MKLVFGLVDTKALMGMKMGEEQIGVGTETDKVVDLMISQSLLLLI